MNHFVERDSEMVQLERFFNLTTPTFISRRKVFVVHGLGGIGKTQFAVEFARRHHGKFSTVLWLDGSSIDKLRQSFIDVAYRLPQDQLTASTTEHLERSNPSADIIIRGVLQWLDLPTNEHWLLIIDNVDRDPFDIEQDPLAYDVKEYLPSADHGSILLTSRLASLTRYSNDNRKLHEVDENRALEILENNAGRMVQGK